MKSTKMLPQLSVLFSHIYRMVSKHSPGVLRFIKFISYCGLKKEFKETPLSEAYTHVLGMFFFLSVLPLLTFVLQIYIKISLKKLTRLPKNILA